MTRSCVVTGGGGGGEIGRAIVERLLRVSDVVVAISTNIALAVVDCVTAICHFLATGIAGAIANVASHQARRAVPCPRRWLANVSVAE